jgi:Zn-dependent protease with chaperone function
MSFDFGSLSPGQVILLIAYLIGQAAVAVVAPSLTYLLTRPHLKRVEAKADIVAVKVAEVAEQTNGMQAVLADQARAAGYAAGVDDAQTTPGTSSIEGEA